jgi:hypothetical protein
MYKEWSVLFTCMCQLHKKLIYKPNTVQSSKQTYAVLNMQRKEDNQTERSCGLTSEIFWIYCNVNIDSTSLYCNGNCIREDDGQHI